LKKIFYILLLFSFSIVCSNSNLDLLLKTDPVSNVSFEGFNIESFINSNGKQIKPTSFTGCNFNNADMGGLEIGRATFDNCSFEHTNFEKTVFNKHSAGEVPEGYFTTFKDCNLSLVNFGGESNVPVGAYLYNVEFENCNLSGATFESGTLFNSLFSSCYISNADVYFNSSTLKNIKFESCSFATTSEQKAIFDDAQLWGITFNGNSNLSYASFNNVQFYGTLDLSDTHLLKANFSNAKYGTDSGDGMGIWFNGGVFIEAIFPSKSFNRSSFVGSSFEAMDLSGFNFEYGNLKNCNFSNISLSTDDIIFDNCSIDGCNFSEASISATSDKKRACFRNCKFYNTNNFEKARLRWDIFTGAEFSGTIDLTGADLHGTYFDQDSFVGFGNRTLVLKGADLSGKDLTNYGFYKTTLDSVDFDGATLTEANFQLSKINSCNFDSSNITKAKFQSSNIKDSTFEEANISGSNFGSSTMSGANFEKATLSNKAYFEKANISKTNFYDSLIGNHDINGTYTHCAASFAGSYLIDISFEKATIKYVNFTGISVNSYINVTDADIKGIYVSSEDDFYNYFYTTKKGKSGVIENIKEDYDNFKTGVSIMATSYESAGEDVADTATNTYDDAKSDVDTAKSDVDTAKSDADSAESGAKKTGQDVQQAGQKAQKTGQDVQQAANKGQQAAQQTQQAANKAGQAINSANQAANDLNQAANAQASGNTQQAQADVQKAKGSGQQAEEDAKSAQGSLQQASNSTQSAEQDIQAAKKNLDDTVKSIRLAILKGEASAEDIKKAGENIYKGVKAAYNGADVYLNLAVNIISAFMSNLALSMYLSWTDDYKDIINISIALNINSPLDFMPKSDKAKVLKVISDTLHKSKTEKSHKPPKFTFEAKETGGNKLQIIGTFAFLSSGLVKDLKTVIVNYALPSLPKKLESELKKLFYVKLNNINKSLASDFEQLGVMISASPCTAKEVGHGLEGLDLFALIDKEKLKEKVKIKGKTKYLSPKEVLSKKVNGILSNIFSDKKDEKSLTVISNFIGDRISDGVLTDYSDEAVQIRITLEPYGELLSFVFQFVGIPDAISEVFSDCFKGETEEG
jgi:uncharacterized protein YjbI with pentapeptide repeats